MRGALWTLVLAGIGGGLLIRGADAAVPSSPASSTDAVASVLATTTPFLGHLLAIAGIGWLLVVALRLD